MENFQFAGLAIILLGAVPCYLLAQHIEKHKHWGLFAGWDPSKISDEDAYGTQLCKGIRGFSIAFGLGGTLLFLNLARGELMIAGVVILSALPMFYYIGIAKSLYGKRPPGK